MVLFLGKLPMKNWQKALAACGLVACMLCIPRLLPKSEIGDVARMEGNIQVVESTLSSGSYADIRVTAGIPVRWITHADEDEINGCNPYPIFAEDREDSEEAVRISYDFLSGAESLFTRWKENGK